MYSTVFTGSKFSTRKLSASQEADAASGKIGYKGDANSKVESMNNDKKSSKINARVAIIMREAVRLKNLG